MAWHQSTLWIDGINGQNLEPGGAPHIDVAELTDRERVMTGSARLPKRLPLGTRYIVEGQTDAQGQFQIFARYVLFPNGRRLDLPAKRPPMKRSASPRRNDRFRRRHAEHAARLSV
jgi:hypothetical protein